MEAFSASMLQFFLKSDPIYATIAIISLLIVFVFFKYYIGPIKTKCDELEKNQEYITELLEKFQEDFKDKNKLTNAEVFRKIEDFDKKYDRDQSRWGNNIGKILAGLDSTHRDIANLLGRISGMRNNKQ